MIETEGKDDRSRRSTLGQSATVSKRAELVVERAVKVERPAARAMLPPDLRIAILEMCAQAHTDHLPVERMLVSLKEKWASHPDMLRLPRGVSEDTLLDCVITQCILDFYADGTAGDSPARRPRPHADRGGHEQGLSA